MTRSVPLWVGRTDDSAIPKAVRLRVFERYGGVCQLSGRKIRAGDVWQLDHRIALVNGGRHEEANLWPVLVAPHKVKSAKDVAIKAKVARVRAKHLGVWPASKAKIRSRGFQRTRPPLMSKTAPNTSTNH
jgi:5-methylcytosine-specific restriction protein A